MVAAGVGVAVMVHADDEARPLVGIATRADCKSSHCSHRIGTVCWCHQRSRQSNGLCRP